MLFNSYEFLLFLPLVLALYWASARWLTAQNVLLVTASYAFYAWWNPRLLLLIVGITLIGWLAGLGISRAGRDTRAAKVVCAVCVVCCLCILGAFKYYDFFVGSFNECMASIGLTLCLPLWHVLLPVGISFYTFQVMGYAIDVRRGKIRACADLLSFAAFVCFFPQLVAGPIERAGDLLPQMRHRRRVRYGQVADGLRQMCWGFVKKMLLADRCAPIVNAIYANPQADGTDLWMAALLFAFQIYGDFSGYSDIAIGCARLFGIRLTRNFNVPYFSRSIAEFWRRWHISLMTWFKDYVYIPLGGSRCGKWRHLRNTCIVFLVSGLWHGADWTFVLWGLYQVIFFVPLILWNRPKALAVTCCDTVARKLWPGWHACGQMLLTFFIVDLGWIMFRAESVTLAFARLSRMFTDVALHTPYGGLSAFYPVLGVMLAEWITRHRRHALDLPLRGPWRFRPLRWAVYYALIFAVLYWGGRQAAFIYFQF